MKAIENRIFEHYRLNEKKIKEAIEFLEENGYIVKEKSDEQD